MTINKVVVICMSLMFCASSFAGPLGITIEKDDTSSISFECSSSKGGTCLEYEMVHFDFGSSHTNRYKLELTKDQISEEEIESLRENQSFKRYTNMSKTMFDGSRDFTENVMHLQTLHECSKGSGPSSTACTVGFVTASIPTLIISYAAIIGIGNIGDLIKSPGVAIYNAFEDDEEYVILIKEMVARMFDTKEATKYLLVEDELFDDLTRSLWW